VWRRREGSTCGEGSLMACHVSFGILGPVAIASLLLMYDELRQDTKVYVVWPVAVVNIILAFYVATSSWAVVVLAVLIAIAVLALLSYTYFAWVYISRSDTTGRPRLIRHMGIAFFTFLWAFVTLFVVETLVFAWAWTKRPGDGTCGTLALSTFPLLVLTCNCCR
jgi:hypothetical protein